MSKLLTHPGPATATLPQQESLQAQIAYTRLAQRKWAEAPVYLRLFALRRFRHCLAGKVAELAESIHRPGRSETDTLVAEVLPVLDACKFLESEGEEILQPYREPDDLRPMWMQRLSVETRREPWGLVLLIAPSNYPLLLAGVQCLQALAAGNAVIWKPGIGGAACAQIFASAFAESGADPSLLLITDESTDAAREALAAGVDKVVLTGSVTTGTRVMAELARTVTPSTMELSGCDSVFVLMDADLDRVVEALLFSCRLNASATCMAARRVFVPIQMAAALEKKLQQSVPSQHAAEMSQANRTLLDELIHEALMLGARLVYDGRGDFATGPVILADVRPDMRIADADIFAPVLGLMPFRYEEEALQTNSQCSYALSVSIFGPEKAALRLAAEVVAGCVVINDVIAPTVDPRVCFGGRNQSGFGVTRGRDGLLEMTTPKSVMVRRGDDRTHYRINGNANRPFFSGYIQAVHGSGLLNRTRGVLQLLGGLKTILKQRKHPIA